MLAVLVITVRHSRTDVMTPYLSLFFRNTPAHGGCPAGSFVDASGAYCCPDLCGARCGGFGCDLISQDCCRSQMDVVCDTGAVPCFKPTGELMNTQYTQI
jgi:hypothetical protein